MANAHNALSMSVFHTSHDAAIAAGPTTGPLPTGDSYMPSAAKSEEKALQLDSEPEREITAEYTVERKSADAPATSKETRTAQRIYY